MANINDARARLKEIGDAIRAKLPEIAEVLTISGKAIAERRIKAAGIGTHYSTNPIPAWFFHGKELNGAGQTWLKQHGVNTSGKAGTATHKNGKKIKKAEKEAPIDRMGTWGEFRAAQGLPVDHKDYSYSNKMWAAMGPMAPVETNGIIVSYLGANNTEAQKKMNYIRDRDGNFIEKALTPEDRVTLGNIIFEQIDNTIKAIGVKP